MAAGDWKPLRIQVVVASSSYFFMRKHQLRNKKIWQTRKLIIRLTVSTCWMGCWVNALVFALGLEQRPTETTIMTTRLVRKAQILILIRAHSMPFHEEPFVQMKFSKMTIDTTDNLIKLTYNNSSFLCSNNKKHPLVRREQLLLSHKG